MEESTHLVMQCSVRCSLPLSSSHLSWLFSAVSLHMYCEGSFGEEEGRKECMNVA